MSLTHIVGLSIQDLCENTFAWLLAKGYGPYHGKELSNEEKRWQYLLRKHFWPDENGSLTEEEKLELYV